MNRIEARIIIMVTGRLAAAKDSEARTEMIEELSENLYQRYLELVEGGTAEEEALKQAIDSLGDVDELLAFLEETEREADRAHVEEVQSGAATEAEKAQCGAAAEAKEAQGGATAEAEEMHSSAASEAEEADACTGTAEESAADDGASEQKQAGDREQYRDGGNFQEEKTASFSKADLENGIEEIVNAAISVTKVAVDCARDVAKDVSDQFRERYPDGVFTQFSGQKGRNMECMAIPAEDVEALDIRLTNGDIELGRTDEPDILIDIEGDTGDVKTMLKDSGVLSVTQGNTASAAFLFLRGTRRTNVEIRLPQKVWESVSVSTTNGDIDIEDELVCRQLKVSTTSGDLDMEHISSENMELKLCSGDICGDDLDGNLYVESKSGDIEVSGCFGRCEMFSASGDVKFAGESREMNCSSTSGDVRLSLERLPEKLKGSSISGDCGILVPADQGFHLSYRTVSGSFSTDIPLAGRLEKKCGDVIYGEAVTGEISLSSVSGDISVRMQD